MTALGDSTKQKRRRGMRVWLVLFGLLWCTAAGWLRAVDAYSDWYWLESVAQVQPGPPYLIATGALWGLVGTVGLAWVYLARPGFRWAGFGTALFFALTYWADRLLVSQAAYADYNLPFAVGLTVLCLGYAFFVLRPDRARSKEVLDGKERTGS